MEYKEAENNFRIYPMEGSCIFRKNKDEYGGLSNMAVLFPLEINGIKIKSSESLYQACKFPNDLDLQRRIIFEKSPFTVKIISKGKETRNDWMKIRVKVMRWCIRVKLAQNYYSFGKLLLSTNGKNIVENSDKDMFWGARKINEHEFRGKNALGRLLMELRKEYCEKSLEEMVVVEPLNIDDFYLLGEKIGVIDMRNKYRK